MYTEGGRGAVRRRFSRAELRATAILAAAALLVLTLVASLPHPWHNERGTRACALCLAYQVPWMAAATPLQIERPAAEARQAPLPDSPQELPAQRIALNTRSPPC